MQNYHYSQMSSRYNFQRSSFNIRFSYEINFKNTVYGALDQRDFYWRIQLLLRFSKTLASMFAWSHPHRAYVNMLGRRIGDCVVTPASVNEVCITFRWNGKIFPEMINIILLVVWTDVCKHLWELEGNTKYWIEFASKNMYNYCDKLIILVLKTNQYA